jgi:predicted transcriptional regulator
VKKTFPQLSQHGISQILGCSVSTVNEALKEVEIIDG